MHQCTYCDKKPDNLNFLAILQEVTMGDPPIPIGICDDCIVRALEIFTKAFKEKGAIHIRKFRQRVILAICE